MTLDTWAALSLGFLGSVHCVAMCGPLALAVDSRSSGGLFISRLVYNLGRTTTYAGFGLLFGAFGEGMAVLGFQRTLSVALGLILLLLAFAHGRFQALVAASKVVMQLSHRVQTALGSRLGGHASPFTIGLLNGLLPCGLVWAAAAGAAAAGSATGGALFMALFGLGTIPALLVTTYIGSSLGARFRHRLAGLAPIVLVLLAALLLARGLWPENPLPGHSHHSASHSS